MVMERVVDTHVHAWDTARLEHPWLSREPALPRRFLPAELDCGGVRVEAAVLVEADCRPDQADAETAWLLDLAREDPRVRGVVAAVPLEHGAACAGRVEELAADPLVVGVRRLLQDEPAGFAVQAGLVEGTWLLAGTGLVSDLCVRARQLAEVTRLAAMCPEVTFVLDHLGKPEIAAGAGSPARQWASGLAGLASLPNVVCKLSGLTTQAAPGTPREPLVTHLRYAVDCFSPARCLFGSDWPVASETATYRGWYETVRAAVSDLGDDEQAGIMQGNAARVYGLAVPATLSTSTETAC